MNARWLLLGAAFGLACLMAGADDWPQWRGPGRDNKVTGFTAPAGSGLPVKTKIPSDVLGSASALASGAWMKNPLLLTPVTIPVVVTVCPTTGDVAPLP